jgi:diguanylate cyclase (GGDEF)-like protein
MADSRQIPAQRGRRGFSASRRPGYPRRMAAWTLRPIDLIDAFGAGVYVLMLVTHADLWWHRRTRMAHFWLALAALGALMVDLTGYGVRHLGLSIPFALRLVNLLGMVVALVAIFELTRAATGRPLGRFARAAQLLVLLLWLGFAIRPHPLSFFGILLICLGFLMFATIEILRSVRSGRSEAGVLAAGLVVLGSCLIYDLFGVLRMVSAIPGLPVLGFSVLFLFAARMLSQRYDREHRELVELRAQLEQRVDERTRELTDANLKLDQLARTDALTGLPNRRSFLDSATQLVALQERAQMAFALVMIDVDQFKRINDEYGHEGGDTALRMVALGLRRGLRQQDIVARWGGEEFIALLPDTAGPAAARVAEMLRKALGELQVDHGAQTIRVSASFGVAEHPPGQRLEATINAADRALYQAKQAGRDRVVLA